MAGPFNGHGIDISVKLEEEKLYHDPYVQLLLRHLNDPALFSGGPQDSRARQDDLLYPYLDFFLRHDKDGYYAGLFKRKGLLETASPGNKLRQNIVREDLVKLSIHSDDLRGKGQYKRLIKGLDPNDPPPGSQTHFSSQTTQHAYGPVTILRSPLTIQMQRLLNCALVKWAIGRPTTGSSCLFQIAPEMTDFITFASFAADVLRLLGSEIIFGNTLREDKQETNIWRRLIPDRAAMKAFLKSPKTPKYLMTGSAGLFNSLSNLDPFKRVGIKITLGIPPVDLGEGGILMTGGGLKRLPAKYKTMRDFAKTISPLVIAKQNGQKIRAPIIDYLGLTESASIFVNRAADPYQEKAWIKFPHPLTYVTTLESAQDLVAATDEGFDRSGLLFFVNFACLDYLEAVLPGDFVKRVKTPDQHQHGFIYDRRAEKAQGFQAREGCGL